MAMFNPAFALAEKTAMEIICGLQQTIKDSDDKGSEAKFMLERLGSIIAPKYPAPRMICFYGNCAVGKSSLVNSALAVDGLSLKVCLSPCVLNCRDRY
jgi:GTP-binding protein EngB required for normal cell division